MSAYQYQPLFEFGSDKTPYRKLTTDGVSTVTVDGLDFLRVAPSVLRELSRQAPSLEDLFVSLTRGREGVE